MELRNSLMIKTLLRLDEHTDISERKDPKSYLATFILFFGDHSLEHLSDVPHQTDFGAASVHEVFAVVDRFERGPATPQFEHFGIPHAVVQVEHEDLSEKKLQNISTIHV